MNNLSRREFIKLLEKGLALSGLAVLTAPLVAYLYPSDLRETPAEPVMASKAQDLPVGQGVTVAFGRYPALVINTPEGLRAYSAVCTHFACIVKWDPDLKQIVCPCHDGFFNPLDGSVISGPPPTPLEPLKVEVINGEIYVGGTDDE